MIDIKELKFNADGLIPAIVVEAGTEEVLMLAYMNEREADEDDEQTAAIMKILKERQMLERSYGTNVNSTIYRLRKELLEE